MSRGTPPDGHGAVTIPPSRNAIDGTVHPSLYDLSPAGSPIRVTERQRAGQGPVHVLVRVRRPAQRRPAEGVRRQRPGLLLVQQRLRHLLRRVRRVDG
eukprot:gene16021-biopygen1611